MTPTESNPQLSLYNEWLAHPVTVRLNRYLRQQRQELMEQWAQGNFTSDRGEATLQLNANAIGQCEVLSSIIDLEFQQLFQEQEP